MFENEITKMPATDGTPENYHRLYQSLNLSDDFLFGKVMRDEEILRLLLVKILAFPIRKVEFVEYQHVMEIDPEAHGIRLDVYADDDAGTRYSVEMQKRNEYNIPKRSRYYLSVMDLDLIEKGAKYNTLGQTFVIFLCLFDPFHRRRQKYTFERICIEENDIHLNDGTSIIILTDADDPQNGDEDIEKFFRYAVDSTTATADSLESDFVSQIHERVLSVKNNRELEVEFVKLLERDQKNQELGFERGILHEKYNIVMTMLSKGVTVKDICEFTGCTEEFIDSVRASEGIIRSEI